MRRPCGADLAALSQRDAVQGGVAEVELEGDDGPRRDAALAAPGDGLPGVVAVQEAAVLEGEAGQDVPGLVADLYADLAGEAGREVERELAGRGVEPDGVEAALAFAAEVDKNDGPGVLGFKDVTIANTQVRRNRGPGLKSQTGAVHLRAGTTASAVSENAGVGIHAAGFGGDEEGRAVELEAPIVVSGNASWGVHAESAGVDLGNLDGAALPSRSEILENGGGDECFDWFLESDTDDLPDVLSYPCEGGGILAEEASGGVRAHNVTIDDNHGDGIFAEGGGFEFGADCAVDLKDATVWGNEGVGVKLTAGHLCYHEGEACENAGGNVSVAGTADVQDVCICECGDGICALGCGEDDESCGVDCGCGVGPGSPGGTICNTKYTGYGWPEEYTGPAPAGCWCDEACQWRPEGCCADKVAVCGPKCGDGFCQAWFSQETCVTCPEDCGGSCPGYVPEGSTAYCGDGVCGQGVYEDDLSCPQDCGCEGVNVKWGYDDACLYFGPDSVCTCNGYSATTNCWDTCSACGQCGTCGDGACDPKLAETCHNCPADCGTCACDGVCQPGETALSCLDQAPLAAGTYECPPWGCGYGVRHLPCDLNENHANCPGDCPTPSGTEAEEIGACCLGFGTCAVRSQTQCAAMAGGFGGIGSTCEDVGCP